MSCLYTRQNTKKCYKKYVKKPWSRFKQRPTSMNHNFHWLGLLGRVSHGVALSVYMYVPSQWNLFWGLSLALISHDQFPGLSLAKCPSPSPPRRFSRLDAWIVPAFCSGSSPSGALKTRRCSGLDSRIVPAWTLKSEELFRMGLVDRPRVDP